MRTIRSLLVSVAATLLVCQCAAAAAPPVMACAASADEAEQEIVCTCVHAPGVECPMHKAAKNHRRAPASREPRCCAHTPTESGAIVTALDGPVGLPETRHVLTRPWHESATTADPPPATLCLASPPSSPPPRS